MSTGKHAFRGYRIIVEFEFEFEFEFEDGDPLALRTAGCTSKAGVSLFFLSPR